MRKLIFTGVIWAFIVISFIIYLRYDKKKFIEELSLASTPQKQQVQRTTKKGVSPLVTNPNSVDAVIQARDENPGTLNMDVNSIEDASSIETNWNTNGEVDNQYIGQTLVNTGLSPELEKLFSEFHPIHQQSLAVNMELGAITEHTIDVDTRLQEIGRELSNARDEPTKQKLYSERKSIYKEIEDIKPVAISLQEESRQLANDRLRLFKKYGYSTEMDFWEDHEETYLKTYEN